MNLFHGPQVGMIFSLLAIAGGIGGGVETWLGGRIFDIMGSYRISFDIVLLTLVIIVVLFWLSSPSPRREIG